MTLVQINAHKKRKGTLTLSYVSHTRGIRCQRNAHVTEPITCTRYIGPEFDEFLKLCPSLTKI